MAEQKMTRHGKPYLYEVDFMRCVFIFGVLLNHTTTAFGTAMNDSLSKSLIHATHLSLHFTRMGFMFMTGLVLFLNYYGKNSKWLTFWKRRYTSVGIPYLAWNAILLLFVDLFSGIALNGMQYWKDFSYSVLHGNNFYLYYVFVVFQLYLIFPAFIWLFRKFKDHHRTILLVSFTIQLALLIGVKYGLPHIDNSGWPYIFRAYGNNVLMYQAYFLAGGYTAIHYQKVTAFLTKFKKQVYAIAVLLSFGTFLLYEYNGRILKLSFSKMITAQQPYLMVYALVMVAVVFLIGQKYAFYRMHGLNPTVEKFIATSSKVSFGIYLVQTIPLAILSFTLSKLTFIPSWLMFWGIPIGYAFVVGSSFLISYFCLKVPPFDLLIGRGKLKWPWKFKQPNSENIAIEAEKKSSHA